MPIGLTLVPAFPRRLRQYLLGEKEKVQVATTVEMLPWCAPFEGLEFRALPKPSEAEAKTPQ